jgi:hypothetical protein
VLTQYFFRVVGALLTGVAPDEGAVDVALDAIVNLFRSLQRPAQRTVQGLWGELAMIAWAHDPTTALASWHSSPRALHDFASGDERLEVKSSTTGLREHRFRLEQLTHGSLIVVASLLLVPVDDGLSIVDLIQKIALRVGDEGSKGRLEVIVGQSLGADWRDANSVRFDDRAAHDSLRLYRADGVPRVEEPLSAHVKDVSFTADLSAAPELERGHAAEISAIMSAFFKKPTTK